MNKKSPIADLMNAESADVEGVIERIVYENLDNGFFVARLRQEGNPELLTFVGNLMAVSVGETIRIRGRWINDQKWGRQVRAESYETILPNTLMGIERYLGSGLIHGIGKVYAKRLIKAFGVETLKVIDKEPDRLTSVEGIGPKRATQIREAWESQKAIQSIMVFLQGHGIGTGQAVRIYKRYDDAAVAVLRENPYRLAEDITGIGFQGADKIAASLGIAKDSAQRLEAGLHYVLQQATSEGHDFLTEQDLFERTTSLLKVQSEALPPSLASMVATSVLVREEDALFLSAIHAAERACEHYLKRLLRTPKGGISIDGPKAIEWVEATQKISLSEEQKLAVREAADAKAMILTGGPGTGKTTLINCIIRIFEKKGLNILLAAPTGRAAKRMEETTGRTAKTIHRLLEFSLKDGGFVRNENNPLSADVVMIDEMSMVDIQLMEAVLRAAPAHARLFMVGDVDQLRSVGPGNVLLDIISSNVITTVRLETVFRQAEESGIVANAHRINAGKTPEFNAEDFFFIECKEPENILDTIIELVAERIPSKFGLDSLRDIQVMAPMRRGDLGVVNLNDRLQEALNPKGAPVPKRNFRLGDKVMQTRNNYELDVYNGDAGMISLVDEDARELHVRFDDHEILYSFEELDNLTLAYAITVHKSQGSEYPAIIMPLVPQHFMMLQRNVLYTAITRGKRLVILVGNAKALHMAIRNTDFDRRNTRLAERLRNTQGTA
jgi:exodeoxyribonuclease V alpha subunit